MNFRKDLMVRSASPTARRRQLGMELRKLREQAGLTGEEVAQRLQGKGKWYPAKASKIEKGRISVPWSDVSDLLDLYGVTARTVRDALITLAREAGQQSWWQSYGDALTKPYSTFIGLESSAESLRVFAPLTVPGLLQTEDYARAVMRGGPLDLEEAEIERRVELRMNRQQAVAEGDYLRLWVILDEAALHRETGGKEVMRAQLQRLEREARSRRLTLQVIPFGIGSHASMAGAFGIFDFEEEDVRAVAYAETVAGELFLERSADVKAATVAFGHLRAAALDPRETLSLLAEIASE